MSSVTLFDLTWVDSIEQYEGSPSAGATLSCMHNVVSFTDVRAIPHQRVDTGENAQRPTSTFTVCRMGSIEIDRV